MTILVVWYEPEDDGVWAISDTRISRRGQYGTCVQTDNGSKLFTFPVVARTAWSDRSQVSLQTYSAHFGFGFAGDVLPSVMTYSAGATLAQNLISREPDHPPRLRDVAGMLAKIAERISGDVLAQSGGHYGRFEGVLFGYCHAEGAFLASVLRATGGPGRPTVEVQTHDLRALCAPVILGSGSDRLRDTMARLHSEGEPWERRLRIPKLAVEAIVREDRGDVGGALSIGWSTRQGFSPMGWATPVELGAPAARLLFNGLDIDELGPVGRHLIGVPALA